MCWRACAEGESGTLAGLEDIWDGCSCRANGNEAWPVAVRFFAVCEVQIQVRDAGMQADTASVI